MSSVKVKTGKRNTTVSRTTVRQAVKAHVNSAPTIQPKSSTRNNKRR